ncbi:hypothetical protein Tco_0590889 [Tanacetum coccineum]
MGGGQPEVSLSCLLLLTRGDDHIFASWNDAESGDAEIITAAWAQSMDACDQTHSEGILLRTTVMTQQSEIVELQAADRRRQTVISELLKADYQRQRQLVEALKIVKSLKTQMIELQTQQGPAKDPAEPELPEEASSSSYTCYARNGDDKAIPREPCGEGNERTCGVQTLSRLMKMSTLILQGYRRSGQLDPVV